MSDDVLPIHPIANISARPQSTASHDNLKSKRNSTHDRPPGDAVEVWGGARREMEGRFDYMVSFVGPNPRGGTNDGNRMMAPSAGIMHARWWMATMVPGNLGNCEPAVTDENAGRSGARWKQRACRRLRSANDPAGGWDHNEECEEAGRRLFLKTTRWPPQSSEPQELG